MSMTSNDLTFRIVLIGDTGVGKTCLIGKHCNDTFNASHDLTIGVEFGVKSSEIKDTNRKSQVVSVKSHFWDTAGQESFRSITRSYYRNSAAVILCYDISRYDTFKNVTMWLEDIRRECSSDTIVILVGTKSDLDSLRQVKTDKAQEFASKNKLMFMEVSAKKDKNIKELFTSLTERIYYDYRAGLIKSGIKCNDMTSMTEVQLSPTPSSRTWCCFG